MTFKKKVIKAYFEWIEYNKEEVGQLTINERINRFLKHEREINFQLSQATKTKEK